LSRTNSTYQASPQNFFPFSYEETIGESAPDDFLYVKENHLGSVLATVSDRKISVDNNSDNIVDFYMADVRAAYDYYGATGMIMPGRLFESESYRYGAQGSEVVPERNGTRNTITTFYREADLRKMQWDSPDPKARPDQSPYVYNDNNGVNVNDPRGDCPTCKVEARITAAITFGTKGKSSFSLGAGVGLSAKSGSAMGSFNLSVRGYAGGLLGSKGLNDPQFDITASPAITFGGGTDATPSTLSSFTASNIDAVSNPFKSSFTVASHNVLNFGQNNFTSGYQRVGGLEGKSGDISVSTYNDFFPGIGDGNDRKNTGGADITFGLPGGNSATVGANIFTGERWRNPITNATNSYRSGGSMNYQMRAGTGNYNNGIAFLSVSNSQFTLSTVIMGRGMMAPQDFLHDNFPSGPLSHFSNSNMPSSLQLGGAFTR